MVSPLSLVGRSRESLLLRVGRLQDALEAERLEDVALAVVELGLELHPGDGEGASAQKRSSLTRAGHQPAG